MISKKAWLQLKEDFLNRQKQEIAELKHKFAELGKQLDDLKSQKEKKSKPESKCIERGSIVKIALDANNDEHFKLLKMTRQQFKDAMLKDYVEHVAYVDVEKTLNRVLVRCKSPEAAKSLLNHENILTGFTKSLLEGDDEDMYFGKIDASRTKKCDKKEKKLTKNTQEKQQQTLNTLKVEIYYLLTNNMTNKLDA